MCRIPLCRIIRQKTDKQQARTCCAGRVRPSSALVGHAPAAGPHLFRRDIQAEASRCISSRLQL